MADESWKREGEEEEDEEEVKDETDYRAQNDAVLFAIDVSSSMLAPPPPSDDRKADKDSPTAAALKCVYQVMQQRIISNPKDMMGVLLFGTKKSKFQEEENTRGTISYPHCYLLSDLDVPSAEDVKALRSIVEDEDEAKSLLEPSDVPVSMANLLFCANQIFTTRAPDFGSRRLFIITDNDDPHADDKALRNSAAVRAKDLYDLSVKIELFPISRADHEFSLTKFYDDIIYRDPAETDTQALGLAGYQSHKTGGDGITLMASLISDINSKQVAKRALFSNMPLEIGPDFKISVKGYNILMRQKPARTTFVYVDGEQAQIVKGETEKVDEHTKAIDDLQIRKAYKFGGEQVLFTPEELKELKNFGPAGIRIIGFKPQSLLPHWASMNKSTFIFPTEDDYVGSTRVFSALWQKLLKDKKMGIAWYIARTNATPVLVAILPSMEKIDPTSGGQIIPQGLWLYPLPFADDVRQPPDTPKSVVSPDELVDAMRIIVQQLQLPRAEYDPSKYPNPALQWHYRILQALALDEEVPEVPEDKTVPKYRQIHKRAGHYAMKWGEILEQQTRAYQKKRRDDSDDDGGGSGRGGGGGGGGPPRKRVKTEPNIETLATMSNNELRKCVENGKLGKKTIPELKEFCTAKGLPLVGKKAELVERVEEWIEKNE